MYIEVTGQLHVPPASYTGKVLPLSIGWDPQPDVEAVEGRYIVDPITRISFFIFTC
jgi:hypothetical protein